MNNIGHVKLTDGLLETIKRDYIPGLLQELESTGGFSINVITGKSPKAGYMVSLAGYERINAIESVDAALIIDFIRDNAAILERPGVYLGAWDDQGQVYFDVSVNILDHGQALNYGVEQNQIAIYCLDDSSSETIFFAYPNGCRPRL